MTDKSRQQHIIFGTGALGLAVARSLQRGGIAPRMINRSGRTNLEWGADVVQADAAIQSEAIRVARDATVIYHCAQPSYVKWTKEAPAVMNGIIAAAEATGAKLIYGDNLYMYGPAPMPLVESLPHRPVGPNTRTRAQLTEMLMRAHQEGKVQMAIARGSNFYGPYATTSTMGERVFPNALQGKAAQVLGSPDLPHTYTFIDDFAEALIILGERDEALGEVWHVPSGETRTTRGFVKLIYEEANQEPKLARAPGWAIRLMSNFNPMMRAVSEVMYQSERPWIMDTTKFIQAFGDISTPHKEAIRQTLAWYRQHGRAASG